MERGFCKSRNTVRLSFSWSDFKNGYKVKNVISNLHWGWAGWAPQAEQCCTKPVWPGRLTGKESVTRTCHPGSRGHGGPKSSRVSNVSADQGQECCCRSPFLDKKYFPQAIPVKRTISVTLTFLSRTCFFAFSLICTVWPELVACPFCCLGCCWLSCL